MVLRYSRILLLSIAILVISVRLFANGDKDSSLFNYSLKSIDGKKFDLALLGKNKASVLIFMSPDCPISQKYTLTINELDAKYADKNVHFYLLIPGDFYSKKVQRAFKKNYNILQPILMDDKLLIARNLNANITPEAFLIAEDGHVLYSGRIDNWYEALGKSRFVITEKNLEDALNSYLSGKEIKIKKTTAVGCIIQK